MYATDSISIDLNIDPGGERRLKFMNSRVLAGSVLSYGYNNLISHFPSRSLRMFYLRLYLADFGKGTNVQMGCRFLNGRKVHLGDRNVINFGNLFDGRRHHIRIGDDVSIGPEACILTLGHEPESKDFSDKGGDVVIGDKVWIACRAVVLPGVEIGEGAVVGAGSVVSQDVEPYTVVAGNPAKFVKPRPRSLKYALDYKPWLV